MKKVLIFALLVGSIGIVAPAAQAKATETSVGTITETTQTWRQRRRTRRVGAYRYRETIRVTYLPNGRTRTQVIRRVRLTGGRRW